MELIQALKEAAEQDEKYSQGEGRSMLLFEAAQKLEDAEALIREIEFSVSTFEKTGKDTFECPSCGASSIFGLAREHSKECKIHSFLS